LGFWGLKMSDFTKDELELGSLAISAYLIGQAPIEMEFLYEKINNMIDNYCHHEEDGILYYQPDPKPRCAKCGVFFNIKNSCFSEDLH
jgi:hypothetical protein